MPGCPGGPARPRAPSFFVCQAALGEEVPDRRRAGPNPVLGQKPGGDLMQRDILVDSHKIENEGLEPIKLRARRMTQPSRLQRTLGPPLLVPLDRRGRRHGKPRRRRARRHPFVNRRDNTTAKLNSIRPYHICPRNQTETLNHVFRPRGIPFLRFYDHRTCSRARSIQSESLSDGVSVVSRTPGRDAGDEFTTHSEPRSGSLFIGSGLVKPDKRLF